jgi:hypothetical protein
MAPPIVFFHQNFEPYLAFTVWQARQTNPDSPVYLLGDAANDLTSLGATHVPFHDFAPEAREFIALYKHLSTHELECERLCFERWFYLLGFLKKFPFEEFYFLDSDYFLLMNIEPARVQWAEYEMGGVLAYAFAWFSRPQIIGQFCSFVLNRYRDPAQILSWRNAPLPGISDMTLWMMFIKQPGFRHLDLRRPRNGLVFDDSLSNQTGFRMRGQIKELTRRGGKCFGWHEKTNEPAQFAGLHLQGYLSKRIGPLFTGWPLPVVRACWRPPYLRNWRKLAQMAIFCQTKGRTIFAPGDKR